MSTLHAELERARHQPCPCWTCANLDVCTHLNTSCRAWHLGAIAKTWRGEDRKPQMFGTQYWSDTAEHAAKLRAEVAAMTTRRHAAPSTSKC